MNLMNISVSTSNVFGAFDGTAIRLGLLISDVTFTAGDLHNMIRAAGRMTDEKESMKMKMAVIAAHAESKPEDLGITAQDFEHIRLNYTFLKNIKYKTSEQLRHYKTIEKMISDAYNSLNQAYSAGLDTSGMTQLGKFAHKELEFNAVHTDRPEFRNEIDDGYLRMSEVLLDRYDKATPNDIYLVTGHFGEYLKLAQVEMGELGNSTDKHLKVLCAKDVLTLPNLIQLTANEIELVREHLMSTNQTFRTNITNWNNDLITTEFARDNFKMINKRYISDIEPYVKMLQTEINKNERLKLLYANTHKNHVFEVSLYVTSIDVYWSYLFYNNSIGEETMDALKNYPNYEKLKNYSCLIIEGALITLNQDLLEDTAQKKNNEPIVLTKRKTLDF